MMPQRAPTNSFQLAGKESEFGWFDSVTCDIEKSVAYGDFHGGGRTEAGAQRHFAQNVDICAFHVVTGMLQSPSDARG